MLKTVCSTYHQLQEAFIGEAGASLKGGGPARLLVVAPSRATADRLQQALTDRYGHACGVSFQTFISVAVNLAAHNPPPRRAPSGKPYPLAGDSGFHDFIVRFITETFPGCQPPSHSRGFAGALRSSLRDLVDGLVEPAVVLAHADEGAFGEDETERMRWLMRVFAYYRKCAEHIPVTNYGELFSCAAQNARECAWLNGFDRVFCYGFYDLTGLQLELFNAITSGREAVLFYPYVKGHPAYAFASRFYETHVAGKTAETQFIGADWSPLALGGALEAMFSPGVPGIKTKRGALSIISVSGHADEIHAAAKEILRLKEDAGIPYRDIAVVARTLEPYAADLPEIFSSNAIPFESSIDLPLLCAPLAQVCRELLFLRRNGYPAHEVLRIAASPYSKRNAEGRVWKTMAEKKGLTGGLEQWRSLAAGAKAAPSFLELGGTPDAQAAKTLSVWVEDIEKTLASLEQPGDWEKRCKAAGKLLASVLDTDALSRYEKGVLDTFTGALDGLEAYGLVRRAREGEFLDELEPRLDGARIAPEVTLSGGVRVLDVMAARGQQFEAVVLIGLNEKLFPRLVREDPVLRDGPRRFLRDHAGFMVSPKLEAYDEEQLLFHGAAASARKKLVCVFQRSDEGGRAVVPSFYLDALCRACGFSLEDKGAVKAQPRQEAQKLAQENWLLLSRRELSLKIGLSKKGFLPEHEPLGIFPPAYLRWQSAADEIGGFAPAAARDGLTGPLPGFEEKVFSRGISPSAAQKLADCPLHYFFSYALGLDDRESALSGDALAADVRGRIYHAILQRVHERAFEAGFPGDASVSLRELHAACEDYLSPATGRALGIYPVLWEVLAAKMRVALTGLVEADCASLSGYAPEFFEQPLSAVLDEMGGSKWYGRADRIDVDRKNGVFRVVDYKSSARTGGISLSGTVLKGEMLQPLIYPLLAEKCLPQLRGLKPAGAAVLAVHADESLGKKRIRVFSFADIAPNYTKLAQGVSFILSLARRGVFFLRPSKAEEFGWCAFCDYGTLCRKNHPASRRRAALNPDCRERELRSRTDFYE